MVRIIPFILLCFATLAKAAGEAPQSVTLDGDLLDASMTSPVLDAAANFKVQILNPAKNCVLYEERQTVNTSVNGTFNIQVGSATGAAQRTAVDPHNTMAQVYQNTVPINGASCTYTPVVGDVRYFRIIVTPSATGVAETLAPDVLLDSVPSAIVADTVGGFGKDSFVQINSGQGVTQANLQSWFSGSAWSDILAGTYIAPSAAAVSGVVPLANGGTGASSASAARSALGLGPLATLAPTGTAGATTFLRGDGTWSAAGGGSVTSVTSANTDIAVATSTTTPVLTLNSGTGANQIVKLDGTGKLPAVDGSALTNLSASSFSSGTVPSSSLPTVPVSKGGTGLTAAGLANQVLGMNAGATGLEYKTIAAGSGVTISNSAGTMTITATTSGGSVTNVSSANTDLSVATGTSTPVLTVNSGTSANQLVKLDGSAKLPAVDGSALTNLSASNLSSGTVPSTLLPIIPTTKGGTGLVAMGTANQLLGMNAGATGLEYKTIAAGTGVTISNAAGVLTINAAGSGGTVTSVTASAPLSVATGTSTPALSIARATSSVDGYLAATDFATFSSKLDGSSAFAGDVSGTSSTTSVDKLKGKGVTYTSIASGQYLKYNGTGWVNSNIAASDITSGTFAAAQMPAFTGDVTSTAGSTALTLGTVPVAKGGTGLTTAPANGQVLIGNGTGYTLGTITAGSGVTIANAAGGITINATGSGGSVTNVSSANADISVASATTTPVLTLNSGIAANQIVKLDGSAKLPAVDGSALTNVNATKLQGTAVTITTLISGNFLKYNGTAWVNTTPSSADLSDAGSLIKSSQMPANCSAGQTLTFSSPTGTWACTNITVTASNFGSQSANTVLAAPSGVAGTPTFRSLVSADLPTAGTAGTYGSATQVPVVTTDAYGRVTAVTNTNITASATGLSGVVPVAKGGTGLSTSPTNGQLLIGNGTGYALGTLSAGTGVTIVNSAGGVTISAAGSGGTVTNVTATAPLAVATGTTTPALTISQATTSTNGYLSSADWNTFNGKLSTTTADATYFKNGGNSFGASASLGTIDSNSLTLKTASSPRMTLDTSGNVGIGTTSPSAGLDIATSGTTGSAVVVPRDTTTNRPTSPVNGMIRYNTSTASFEGYAGGVWGSLGGGANGWQIITTNYTAGAGDQLMIDTSGGAVSVTLPATPAIGQVITFMDVSGSFATNNLTVVRNGQNIMSLAQDMTVSTTNLSFQLIYSNATYGWRIK